MGGRGCGGGGRGGSYTHCYTVTTRMIPALRWTGHRPTIYLPPPPSRSHSLSTHTPSHCECRFLAERSKAFHLTAGNEYLKTAEHPNGAYLLIKHFTKHWSPLTQTRPGQAALDRLQSLLPCFLLPWCFTSTEFTARLIGDGRRWGKRETNMPIATLSPPEWLDPA